jgi:hypothetical protein
MLGRLISPVLAHLAPFVGASAEDPDFKEPRRFGNEGPGVPACTEGAPLRLPCQVEPDEVEALRMEANGETPRSRLHLVFHRRDIRRLGVAPKVRDRLVALTTLRGEPITEFPNPPGLFATEARPLSFGLSRTCATANLLRVTFEDRPQGARRLA